MGDLLTPGRHPLRRGSLLPRFPSSSKRRGRAGQVPRVPRGPALGGGQTPPRRRTVPSPVPSPGLAGARSRSRDTSLPRTWSRAPRSRTGRPWGRGTAARKASGATQPGTQLAPEPPPPGAPPRPAPPSHTPRPFGSNSGISETVTELQGGGGSGRDFGTAVGWPLGHVGEVPLQIVRLTGLEQGLFPRGSHAARLCAD